MTQIELVAEFITQLVALTAEVLDFTVYVAPVGAGFRSPLWILGISA